MLRQSLQIRYSIPEAAQILRLSVPTVWRRIKAGHLQSVRDGGRVFISHEELCDYAARGTRTLKAS